MHFASQICTAQGNLTLLYTEKSTCGQDKSRFFLYNKKVKDVIRMEKFGELYLVATPIGNMEDITLRAIKTLKNVDIIAAEDTRHTLKLLNHLEISKPLISYYRHNEDVKSDVLIEKLKEGKNIALVSDAGTPGISDPGEEIVKKCIEENINIIPIPGACAMVTALVASGLDTKEFTFYGFLPMNKKLRKAKLAEISENENTIVIYEAPHKLDSTLEDLKQVLKDRKITIARELTKIHEEFIRGNLENIEDKISNIKGEFVLIVEGKKKESSSQDKFANMSLEEHYEFYAKEGLEKKEIIKLIAKDRKVAKNEIYRYFLNY